MIECLISVVIVVIVAVIVLYILQFALNAVIALPPPVWQLVRLLVGLLVLLYALRCFGIFGDGPYYVHPLVR